ncbi:MAG: DUF5610 domain-containing protein [Planctomycetaceae bacterium]|nr:DUF5610 domain-containing protein [Planctomycetaceae bacterium]
MINNFSDHFRNLYSNRGNSNESGGPADVMRRLRERRDAIRNGGPKPAATEATDEAAKQEAPAAATKKRPNYAKAFEDSKNPEKKKATEQKAADEANLSPHEKRQKALQEIMDRLDAEEAAKYPNRVKKDKTDASSTVTTVTNPEDASKVSGLDSFLNDLPLFNEFKSSLADAFKSLDGATSGSISAQYELNYTSMQYIAAENGNYEYQETTLSIKLDLNYVKAAAGGSTGSEIAGAIENAKDFESLMSSLQDIASKPGTTPEQAAEQTKGMPEFKGLKPEDFLTGMKDYFGPEATSGRIVDFATMYFPMSQEYKDGGDTEEARKAYSDRMGKAIQKGFDQALGTLGAVPQNVMDGINKTHELTFKGLEDFVKNGMNQQKQDSGVYESLEKFAFSFEMNYSQTSVKYNTYDSRGQTQGSGKTPSVNTEA